MYINTTIQFTHCTLMYTAPFLYTIHPNRKILPIIGRYNKCHRHHEAGQEQEKLISLPRQLSLKRSLHPFLSHRNNPATAEIIHTSVKTTANLIRCLCSSGLNECWMICGCGVGVALMRRGRREEEASNVHAVRGGPRTYIPRGRRVSSEGSQAHPELRNTRRRLERRGGLTK